MKLLASHCVFPTPDIHKTAEYYVEKLGFRRVDYLDAKGKHICLYRDGVKFILTQANTQRVFPNSKLYGCGEDAYVITESQVELQDEFEKIGLPLFRSFIKRIITTWSFPLRISTEDGFVLE